MNIWKVSIIEDIQWKCNIRKGERGRHGVLCKPECKDGVHLCGKKHHHRAQMYSIRDKWQKLSNSLRTEGRLQRNCSEEVSWKSWARSVH